MQLCCASCINVELTLIIEPFRNTKNQKEISFNIHRVTFMFTIINKASLNVSLAMHNVALNVLTY